MVNFKGVKKGDLAKFPGVHQQQHPARSSYHLPFGKGNSQRSITATTIFQAMDAHHRNINMQLLQKTGSRLSHQSIGAGPECTATDNQANGGVAGKQFTNTDVISNCCQLQTFFGDKPGSLKDGGA